MDNCNFRPLPSYNVPVPERISLQLRHTLCFAPASRALTLRAAFGWLIPLQAFGGFVGRFAHPCPHHSNLYACKNHWARAYRFSSPAHFCIEIRGLRV